MFHKWDLPCAAVCPPITVAPSPHGAVISWSSFSGQHCCTLVSRCSSFGGSLGGFVVVRVACSGQFNSSAANTPLSVCKVQLTHSCVSFRCVTS